MQPLCTATAIAICASARLDSPIGGCPSNRCSCAATNISQIRFRPRCESELGIAVLCRLCVVPALVLWQRNDVLYFGHVVILFILLYLFILCILSLYQALYILWMVYRTTRQLVIGLVGALCVPKVLNEAAASNASFPCSDGAVVP